MAKVHEAGISIGHLKPSNILFDENFVRIINLEGARPFIKGQVFTEQIRDFHFASPEMLNGEYSYKADAWSIGVLFFCILTGKYPVHGNTRNEVIASIKKSQFNLDMLEELKLKPEVNAMIRTLLKI